MDVQRQVEEAESQLAHLRVGRAKGAGARSSSGTDPRELGRRSGSGARNKSSASRSQVQFSMICEGSSTKSQATLVPARLRNSTRLRQ